MRTLVTGANGFIGEAVLTRLAAEFPGQCRGAVRRPVVSGAVDAERVVVGDLGPDADWTQALHNIDAVVHTAARVHVMQDSASDPLAEFRRVNVAGTLQLARQAIEAGARRFVFISSIKVNGECTNPGRPYTADDVPAPVDPYGISKHEAEEQLRRLGKETGLEITIIRPVLVYGPGVRANFLAMMRWLHKGVPLPLGAIYNARSLVARDNLVDLITKCAYHPAAANQTFLVSDGEDLSTTGLLREMARALSTSARLVPVPAPALRVAARVLGKEDIGRRLCDSLQVDIKKTRSILGWAPVIGVRAALAQTAESFLQQQGRSLV